MQKQIPEDMSDKNPKPFKVTFPFDTKNPEHSLDISSSIVSKIVSKFE